MRFPLPVFPQVGYPRRTAPVLSFLCRPVMPPASAVPSPSPSCSFSAGRGCPFCTGSLSSGHRWHSRPWQFAPVQNNPWANGWTCRPFPWSGWSSPHICRGIPSHPYTKARNHRRQSQRYLRWCQRGAPRPEGRPLRPAPIQRPGWRDGSPPWWSAGRNSWAFRRCSGWRPPYQRFWSSPS